MKLKLNGYRIAASQIGTTNQFPVVLETELIIDENGSHIFDLKNGVTGYESWYMAMLLGSSGHHEDDFVCCAGTKNKYDRLILYGTEWMRFLKEYFIKYPESKPGYWSMMYE